MAATATKKPHSVSPQQPSNIQQIPSKSRSNTPCKAFIIVVLLLLIPLFPSQAPDFITQTHFTQFWEIIHLLFIGIAVSYGLFATRTAQTAPDKFVDSTLHDSHSYLSGISHLHSIFNDEQDELQNYSNCACECVLTRDDQLIGKGRCVIHGATKIRSFESNDGVENIHEGNGKTVNQAWCSQYSKGKSLVVVSNGKYFLDGSSDYKPLNLPIRSLRSRAVDDDGCELESRKTDPKIEANGNGVVKVRGVVPMNLEKKFEEAAGRSAIPWRSRSENPPSNHQEEEPDRIFAMPKPNPTLPEFHDEEKQHIEPRNATKPVLIHSRCNNFNVHHKNLAQ